MTEIDEKLLLSPGERDIWNAAYAAAFVRTFQECQDRLGFDKAEDLASAETPIAIADLAIIELRRWRKDEKPGAGTRLEQS